MSKVLFGMSVVSGIIMCLLLYLSTSIIVNDDRGYKDLYNTCNENTESLSELFDQTMVLTKKYATKSFLLEAQLIETTEKYETCEMEKENMATSQKSF